jgi:hypothetical protein
MVAFGAGLTWAAAVVKWTAPLSTLHKTLDVVSGFGTPEEEHVKV